MSLTAKLYKGSVPSAKPPKAKFEAVKTFTGEEILYDDLSHTYKTSDNVIMMSGSEYAKNFGKPFDKALIIPNCSKAWGVPADVIDDIWTMKGVAASSFGTAIHSALELAHKYWLTGEQIARLRKSGGDANYCVPKHPVIQRIVMSFVDEYGTDALPEVFVSDVSRLMVGQIDRLEIIDKGAKICRVQDYKTTLEENSKGEMTTHLSPKKVTEYQHQMSFYAEALKKDGWTTEGLDLFVYDYEENKWQRTQLDVLPIQKEYLHGINSN